MLMEHLPDGLEIDGLEVSDEVISDGDAHVRLGRYEGQAVAIELVKNDGAPSRSVEPSGYDSLGLLARTSGVSTTDTLRVVGPPSSAQTETSR